MGAPIRRSTTADIELIRGVGLFSGSTSEVVDEVISESSVERFKNRDFICRAGDSAEVVFLVLQGKVQVVRGTPARHAVLMVMQRGDAFGLRGVLEVGEYTETVVAVGECQILTIPAATFAHAMEHSAAVASNVIRLLAKRLQEVSDHFESILLMPTMPRLACYLLRLAPSDNNGMEVILPYKKALIANYLGMEPESLSRALKKLQPYGVTCHGRKIRIRDATVLRNLCEINDE